MTPETHAYVENGAIRLMQCGRLQTVTRWDALVALLDVEGSPFASSQERARQIRDALNNQPRETTNGHAH